MSNPDQSFNVGLKIFVASNDGKLLVLQDPEGLWELPGGKIQEGEEIEEALQREIAEELGDKVQIEIGSLFHAWIRQGKSKNYFIFLVGFQCTFLGGEIHLSSEHQNLKWIAREDISSLPFENTYQEAVQKFFSQ
jgi:8-oxo-dGTP diphosphatase